MTEKPINELDESDIQALIDGRIPEGLALEFKRELDLSATDQRKEAAKDASALANTVGGRIFYGVGEIRLPDGTAVAGSLHPLSDGNTGARLTDILNTTTQPRLRFDTRHVPVSGGSVLVLEVFPSSALDLHLVSGYGENRFYRRGPSGVVPMTEPEIREAYYRIAETRASLDARVRALSEPELKVREGVDESVLVIPLFSRPSLLDPRGLRTLGTRLRSTLQGSDIEDVISGLRLSYDGYRLLAGGSTAKDARLYLSILKTGVVHLSTNNAFEDRKTEFLYLAWRSLCRILDTLLIAREALSLSHYWGGVRILYRVRPTKPWGITPGPINAELIAAGSYDSEVGEVNLHQSSGQWDAIVRELLDPIYHAAGLHGCTFIETSGIRTDQLDLKILSLYTKLARFTAPT